jgi:chemotaxis signal transduction protein
VFFEAGPARYCVEATSVLEIGAAPAEAETLLGGQTLQDLSQLLGGDPEQRPGFALLFDVSPTLAVRIKRVIDVADAANAPFFLLPPGLGDSFSLMIRGAVLRTDQLYLELAAEMLAPRHLDSRVIPRGQLYLSNAPAERVLVFETNGRLCGIPLASVSQIVGAEGFCPLPFKNAPVVGLLPHAQSLWPIYSIAGMAGEPAAAEPLIILADIAGRNLGVCASRAIGVRTKFESTSTPGEFSSIELDTPVSLLDLDRTFS